MLTEQQYIDTFKAMGLIAMETHGGEAKVNWAMSLLEQGVETDSLSILATLKKFINEFEADDYFNRVLKELNISRPDRKGAVLGYAKVIALEVTQGKITSSEGVSLLHYAYINIDYASELGEYVVLKDEEYLKDVNGWSESQINLERINACKETYAALVYPNITGA